MGRYCSIELSFFSSLYMNQTNFRLIIHISPLQMHSVRMNYGSACFGSKNMTVNSYSGIISVRRCQGAFFWLAVNSIEARITKTLMTGMNEQRPKYIEFEEGNFFSKHCPWIDFDLTLIQLLGSCPCWWCSGCANFFSSRKFRPYLFNGTHQRYPEVCLLCVQGLLTVFQKCVATSFPCRNISELKCCER